MLLAHGPRVVRCARVLAITAIVTLALSVVAAGPAEAEPGAHACRGERRL